jgi:ketosteroid isomerase-like protein
MGIEENKRSVEKLWAVFSVFDFEAAGDLLHDDFVCEWPQSRERIRGRENYIALNAAYPGRWVCTVEQIVAEGDTVATNVALASGEDKARAVSFYEMRDGKIYRQVDYWPDDTPAPASRSQWVETME